MFCVDLRTNCDYFPNTALTEWLKALSQVETSDFAMTVRPPARMKQFSSNWTDFRGILYWRLLLKPIENSRVWF